MRRSGFTLIELMISLALMVIMMLGVNYIFDSVGKVTGTTATLSQMTRDAQAAQVVINQDMTGIVTTNAPFLIIKSQRVAAFKNNTDKLTSPDSTIPPDPMIDMDATGSTSITLSNTIYSSRNHRTDQLKFFSRGSFRRQTGNDGVYIDDMGSTDAMISYGHLKMYNGTGTLNSAVSFPDPGDATVANPNNLYATQWVLGRNVMLLVSPTYAGSTPTPPGTIKDTANVSQFFVEHSDPTKSSLAANVTSNDPAGFRIQSSRFDLVSGSIADQTLQISNVAGASPTTWYQNFTYRFWANPFVLKPLDSYRISQTVPMFLKGCTQFMVEYAGDYLKQDPATGTVQDVQCYVDSGGNVHNGTTDGQIDFVVDPVTKARSIRWYGFPRETSGDGKIPLNGPDVLPLRDVIRTFAAGADHVPMERGTLPAPSSGGDYSFGVSPSTATYQCIWVPAGAYGLDASNQSIPSPNSPSMIRIIYTLDDPDGRLADGQTFEYVFKLQ